MRIVKIILLMTLCFNSIQSGYAMEAIRKVFISKFVDHPALDNTAKGIIDALKEAGFEEGKNIEIKIESAKSNLSLAQQIATRFIHQNPDIVVGIGTISAQSFAREAIKGKVKLVFSSVTDPISAGLVENLASPGNNISGVSNFIELEPQIKLFKELQPNLKKLGVIYNPVEVNSVSIVGKLEALCPKFDMILVKKTVSKASEIMEAAISLAQTVDAIFINNDNTALSSISDILKAAEERRVPIYVSDIDAVELGAVAALGPDQYEIGKQTGRMIARILRVKDIKAESVEFAKKVDLYLNIEAAKKSGIEISPKIIKTAKKIVKRY